MIVKEGLARVKNLKRKEELGARPVYRMASWNKKERGVEKKLKAKKWAGNCESVLFVQAIPGEELMNKIQEVANRTEFKIKVVEKSA